MPLDPRRVKALFNAALDLPDPADRPVFLERECQGEHELRARVEELLAAHDQPASALERPLAGDPGETSARDEPPAGPGETAGFLLASPPTESLIGTTIAGRYKLRQEIGEGGMGSVYLAEQTRPVKRQVALKLVKPGMDSRTVLARFESERQALALMDHPNIARVLDAGATDAGRPFFVMELVKGVPLTEYCDQHRLGLPERLVLFRQICSAVQHAHQKGIIHRDLKPTNILVESHDGHPVPKVIDFGLAKATSGLQLSEQSLFTAFGTVAGTPLYMAPEQASFSAVDIDTRADIYALGVILYELLTGSTPIQRETFKQAALDEILRVIREVEPPTPSSRISTSEALPAIAATRQIEPARLGRFVRGDLDWIVMKALAKERQRRYESAIALAQDVERFVNHEPVSAGPPTAAYRLRKLVRRNRLQVVAALLVLLALCAGIVGTTLGLVEARRQERIAVAERRQAEKRLTQIEKANEILGSIFKDLNPQNEERDAKPLLALLGERLDQATAQIEGEAIGDPLTVARMQMTLGSSLLGLGYPEKAIALFAKARETFATRLGPDHPDTIASMDDLARGYYIAGKSDRVLPLYEEVLALRKAKLGPDHPDTLYSMYTLAGAYRSAGRYDRALLLYEEVLALRKAKLGPDHRDTLQSMNSLASWYKTFGQFDRAVSLLEGVLALRKAKLGPDDPDTLSSMGVLADAYRDAGKYDRVLLLCEEIVALTKSKRGPDHLETLLRMDYLASSYTFARKYDRALPLYEEILALTKAKLGPEHPRTLQSKYCLAWGYRLAGKLDRARPLFEETLALMKSKLGPDHPSTLGCMNFLALTYSDARKFDQALPLFEEVLAVRKAKLGPDHPDTLGTMNNLAYGYSSALKFDQALPLYEETMALRKAKLGPDHPDTLGTMNSLALGYQAAGRFDRALPLFEETLALRKAKLGPDHRDTLLSMNNLADGHRSARQFNRALPLFEELLALRKAKLGPDHPDTHQSMGNLALAYREAGQPKRALPLHEETYEKMKVKLGPDHPQTLTSMNNLARGYQAVGRFDRALPLFEETLALRRSKLGPDHPQTLSSMNNLAGAYQAARKYDRALPLLRELADRWKREAGADSTHYVGALSALGLNLLRQEKWTDAETRLRELVTIRQTKAPDDWGTFNAKSMLGGALLGQKQYAVAEPLLRDGYEGLKHRAEKIPPEGSRRLAEALDRLIALAEATNRPDDVKLWKDEKAKLPGATAPKPATEDP
jgi:tetratricopeptide (TPR) repeat protein/tRNA A-37 threonylcarbamoyl transferase component Bud32